jgi:hypothetical protein
MAKVFVYSVVTLMICCIYGASLGIMRIYRAFCDAFILLSFCFHPEFCTYVGYAELNHTHLVTAPYQYLSYHLDGARGTIRDRGLHKHQMTFAI